MKVFVNAHVNASTPAGRKVATRYGVHAYPTLVVVDEHGGEIDRIIGYRPPDKFLPEIQRILRGEGTLPALRHKAEQAPEDVGCVVAYAEKLLDSDPSGAAKRLRAMATTVVSPDPEVEAHKWFVLGKAVEADRTADGSTTSALDLYKKVAIDFAGTRAATEAVHRGARLANRLDPDHAQQFFDALHKAAKTDKDRAIVAGLTYTLHLRLAAEALKAQGDAAAAAGDAQAMNQVAWNFYEHRADMPFRRYLRVAIGWAAKAAELSKRDPAILDTHACLLSVTGQLDAAIALEEEALEKVKGKSMQADFEKNLREWKKQRDDLKARHAIPAVPIVPR